MTEPRRDPLFDALREAAANDEPRALPDHRALALVERALYVAEGGPKELDASLRARSPFGRRWAMGSLAAVAALVIALAWPAPAIAPRVEPAPQSTARGEPTHSELPTGDRLVASPGATYRVESVRTHRRVRLARGALLCEVASLGPGTGFTLATPHLEIEVLGTVFSVDSDRRGTTVWVYEGRVRVREGSSTRVLEAGESTTSRFDPLASEAREAAQRRRGEVRVAEVEPGRQAALGRAGALPVAQGEPRRTAVTLQAVRALLAQRRAEDALRHVDAQLARRVDADWLVLRADALRALERHEEGITTLERAAAIAPERRATIGYRVASTRYRALNDAAGALEALVAYGVTEAGSPLAERGLALEIDACDRLGRAAQRQQAVGRYLALFPDTTRAGRLRSD